MTKHIQQFILQVFHGQFVVRNVVGLMPKYSVLGGDTYLVSIFSLHKMKMSEQHVGVVLTVIKVSSSDFYSACGNSVPGSFQNKSLGSFFKWVPKYILFLTKLHGETRSFLEWASIVLSSKLSLTCRVTLTIIKMPIIRFLLCLLKQTAPWQFSKQISKILFEMSVQVYFLLGKTEGERKSILGGYKMVGCIMRLLPRTGGYYKIQKKSLFLCNLKKSHPSCAVY